MPHPILLLNLTNQVHCLLPLLRMHAEGKALEVYHALRGGALAPGRRRRRTVFVLQSNQMAIGEALLKHYAVPRSEVVLIHISDGNTYRASMQKSAARYAGWAAAFRQYWVPDPVAAAGAVEPPLGVHPPGAPSSLAAAEARGEIRWFPIGMNPQWVQLLPSLANGSIDRPRASMRSIALSFLGSTDKSMRSERVAAIGALLEPLGIEVYHHQGNVACYGTDCKDERYVRETLQSRLCLQLPGSSVESNRLYEQLEGGCIPVIVLEHGPGEEQVHTPSDRAGGRGGGWGGGGGGGGATQNRLRATRRSSTIRRQPPPPLPCPPLARS